MSALYVCLSKSADRSTPWPALPSTKSAFRALVSSWLTTACSIALLILAPQKQR